MKAKYERTIALFGSHLRTLREERGLTQLDLSVSSNVDRRSIQRIENGLMNPSLDILIGLALGLDMQLAELLSIKIQESKPLD